MGWKPIKDNFLSACNSNRNWSNERLSKDRLKNAIRYYLALTTALFFK